ncbi:MAG: hypothetical protein IKF52_06115 [Clostridia bacterium]|nr:hypothetical protein [Clostridia bacterium]
MKKIVVSALFIVVILTVSTMVKAASAEDAINYVKTQGGSYITESDLVRIERHFKEYPITEEQGDQLKTKVDAAKAVLDNSGKAKIKDLSKEDKDKLRSIANEAAAILDLNLVFKGDICEIYKDGKLIETAYLKNNQILVYTGNDEETTNKNVLAIYLVAIIALATGTLYVGKRAKSAK